MPEALKTVIHFPASLASLASIARIVYALKMWSVNSIFLISVTGSCSTYAFATVACYQQQCAWLVHHAQEAILQQQSFQRNLFRVLDAQAYSLQRVIGLHVEPPRALNLLLLSSKATALAAGFAALIIRCHEVCGLDHIDRSAVPKSMRALFVYLQLMLQKRCKPGQSQN